MMISKFTLSVVIALCVRLVAAESQAERSRFEVASVRQNGSGSSSGNHRLQPGGRFVARNETVVELIGFVYDVRDNQVIGGPEWVRRARFDVEGRAGSEASTENVREMLGKLLADRFRLDVRREQQEMEIFELVLDRSDRRLGPNLVFLPSREDCGAVQLSRGAPNVPKGSTISMGCGPMSMIVNTAFSRTKTVVVDRTGLVGDWYWFMTYAGDLGVSGATELPSFTTALREQLGVKLQPSREPVDVIRIESIQALSPD